MKRIKKFSIKYRSGQTEETCEWPGRSSEHAVKRFQRARELSRKQGAQLVSVTEITRP